MKRATIILSGAVLAVFLFTAIFIISTAAAQTRSATAVPGAKFEVSFSMKENLKAYIGKDVLIHLRSGHTFQGYVKAVGDQVVHLEKLSGRDFYDALIRIDDISAIEAKFREMK
jgi:small nuclear ribonucleoprotein (snRNP)-like protein